MRKWTIIGLEGLFDDFGYCEPDAAATDIALRIVHGQHLSEQDMAAMFRHCASM